MPDSSSRWPCDWISVEAKYLWVSFRKQVPTGKVKGKETLRRLLHGTRSKVRTICGEGGGQSLEIGRTTEASSKPLEEK